MKVFRRNLRFFSMIALSSLATLSIASCAKPQPDQLIADFAARLEKERRDPNQNPQISKEMKAYAESKRAEAENGLNKQRADAQSKLKNSTNPEAAAMGDCLRDLTPPTVGNDQALASYTDALTRCEKVAKDAEEADKGKPLNDDQKPGFGETDAFKTFIRWAAFVGAVVSIAYGNYPLAAMLLKTATEGGEGDTAKAGAKEGSAVSATNGADKKGGEPGKSGPQIDLPKGWEPIGNSRDGISVAHSPDFQSISFEGANLAKVNIQLSPAQAAQLKNGSLSACDAIRVSLEVPKIVLYVESQAHAAGTGCPEVALTYNPVVKPAISVKPTNTPKEITAPTKP